MHRLARIHNKPWEKLTHLLNLKNKGNCSFERIQSNVSVIKIRNNTQQSLPIHNFKWYVKLRKYSFDQTNCLRQLHTGTINYIRHAKLIEDVDQKGLKSEPARRSKGLDTDNLHDTEFKDDFNWNDKASNTKSYIFEHPKNILNSFYTILSQELGTKFNASVTFTKNNNDWHCTYHLKWPELLKISKRAYNKRDASHKAAVAVLEWLQNCGKINSDGKPVIYDATEMRNMYKKVNRKVLTLSDSIITQLNLIDGKYSNNFFNYLEANTENNVEQQKSADFTKLDNPWPLNYTRQRVLSTKNYLMKETVDLPIQEYKDDIIDLIKDNRIVIIKGETGCGKSIRVPQYVLEGWAKSGAIDKEQCKIIVTQPRRIAAISLAEQVAYERKEEVGRLVGYQVRFKTNFNSNMSRILYCTTGILLRRLQTDPGLNDCTHVILDEAHERDVNTDLLMNLLQYAMKMNPQLRLIVMSATIDTDIFKKYFKDAAVFNIAGRTFSVKEHYIDSNQIINYEKTLKMCQSDDPYIVAEDVVNTIQYIHRSKPEGGILCFLPSWEDIARINRMLPSSADMNVLCLHSKLDIADQKKVFANPPPGVRKVILSTNIAETAVTINDIVYVIDTGIQKLSKFDADKGIMCVDQEWISQANMQQRKGRAGRLQPGESYHLYTKKQLNNFIKYPIPEILRTSLTKIVLDSKVYSNNMNAIEFLGQLPTPPDEKVISQAVNELVELDLLDENENVTPLGKTLSNFQMEPKLAKAIANGVIFRCCTPIIDIAALFSEETNIFQSVLVNQDDIREIKSQFSATSDHLAMVKIFEKWLEYTENKDRNMANAFCSENSLSGYKLYTLQRLRDVYFDYVYNGFSKEILISDEMSDHDELIMAVLSADAGSILTLNDFEKVKGRLKKKKTLLTRNKHKVNISSESVNCKQTSSPTDFMVYINETRSNIRRTTTVRETSFISVLSLLLFKNEELLCREIKESEYSDQLDSNDQVVLALKNARIECICDRSHADAIIKCKEAIRAGVIYYTSQLTCTTKTNPEFEQEWGRMLQILSSILSSSKR